MTEDMAAAAPVHTWLADPAVRDLSVTALEYEASFLQTCNNSEGRILRARAPASNAFWHIWRTAGFCLIVSPCFCVLSGRRNESPHCQLLLEAPTTSHHYSPHCQPPTACFRMQCERPLLRQRWHRVANNEILTFSVQILFKKDLTRRALS